VVCRFGAVTISRRLYRDGKGDYHVLLDEHLGWEVSWSKTFIRYWTLAEITLTTKDQDTY
jgi:hypothetical protein